MEAAMCRLRAVHTVDCSVLADLSGNSVADYRLNLAMAQDWAGCYCNWHWPERSVLAAVVRDWDLMLVLADIAVAADIVAADSFVALAASSFLALAVGSPIGRNCSARDWDFRNRKPSVAEDQSTLVVDIVLEPD